MGSVRIVTDGGADLPAQLAASLDIQVVRGPVRFDGREWDGASQEFWDAVRAHGPTPETCPPAVDAFAGVFAGPEPVCSVHVSTELSRTFEHASEAAGSAQADIRVVDTRSLSVGTALVAISAAEAAKVDGTSAQIERLIHNAADTVHVYAVIEDARYLIRSGRAGLIDPKHSRRGARHVLAVKGHAIPLAQVRSRDRAISELIDHVQEHVHHGVQRWAAAHGDASDVDDFVQELESIFGSQPEYVMPLGPIVGTHAGPGALVVGFLARE
jgi:DegV family protein with EDD domain